MEKKNVILLTLFVLLSTSSLSICQDFANSQSDNGSILENKTAAESMGTISQPGTDPTADIDATTAPNLRYIWSVTGIENEQITMALDQDGEDLFGHAKYESDGGKPWNGWVAGLVAGNEVHLVLTALKGDKLDMAVLDGIFADDAITGEFFQTSEGKISRRGEFNAIWINPDLTSYTPAEIKEPEPEMPAMANDTATSEANRIGQKRTIYHDVHQDADRILTGVGDISQIPIGMGGSGLS